MFWHHLRLVLLWSFYRRGVPARRTYSRLRSEGLHVFASTYNGANVVYEKPENAQLLFQTIVSGHEDADIAIFGFQEFSDACKDGGKVSDYIASNLLFQRESALEISKIMADIKSLAHPSTNAAKSHSALKNRFDEFHGKVSTHLTQMRRHFGGSNTTFLDGVVESSPIATALSRGKTLKEIMQNEIKKAELDLNTSRATADAVRFAKLRESAEALTQSIRDFPQPGSLKKQLEPIRDWRDAGPRRYAEWIVQFPNLKFTDNGQKRVEHFKTTFARATHAAELLDQKPGASSRSLDLIDLTTKFQNGEETMQQVTTSNGITYRCCCTVDENEGIVCELKDTMHRKTRRLLRGCGGLMGKGFHAWDRVASIIPNLEHAGRCIVPRSSLTPWLQEQMLDTAPAFSIKNCGEPRANGNYKLAPWHSDHPAYVRIGDPKVRVEWSSTDKSWRLLIDNYIGSFRSTLYNCSVPVNGSKTVPMSGWEVAKGIGPPPTFHNIKGITQRDSVFRRAASIDYANRDIGKTMEEAQGIPASVASATQKAEDVLLAKLRSTLRKLEGDLAEMDKNLEELESVRRVAADKAALDANERLLHLEEAFAHSRIDSVNRLDHLSAPYKLSLNKQHVSVRRFAQTYHSSAHCRLYDPHYDTALHVFVNPWSQWSVEFPIDDEGAHFNIDNNGGALGLSECGKSVNVVRLKLTHKTSRSSITLCALNTHMSYKGNTTSRMLAMSAAMERSQALRCDAFIFVGDFNTRLHCEPDPKEAMSSANVCRRTPLDDVCVNSSVSDTHGNSLPSSFSKVVGQFCKEISPQGERCSLSADSTNTPRFADELAQFLERDQVGCYEDRQKDLQGHNLFLSSNPLLKFGFSEAGMPNFAPTFMYCSQADARHAGNGWNKCLPNEPICMCNKPKDGRHVQKHNPAWTDRIIIKSSSLWQFATEEYSRRMPPRSAALSDHVPVVARVQLSRTI